MAYYLFYIEGANREVWKQGASEKDARESLWKSLTNNDRNRVIQIECIEESTIKPASQHRAASNEGKRNS